MLSTCVIYRYTNNLDPRIGYGIAGAYGIFAGILTLFFISEPHQQDDPKNVKASIVGQESIKDKLVFAMKVTWTAARNNPAISIGLTAIMIARMQ